MRKSFLLLAFLATALFQTQAKPGFGEASLLNNDWKFYKGDPAEAAAPEFDDSRWRALHLPHDWSVEGPYSPHWASATGYLPGGIAWYRKALDVPAEWKGEKIYIYFERSEEHTSELQSRPHLVCRLLLEKKNTSWMIGGDDPSADTGNIATASRLSLPDF